MEEGYHLSGKFKERILYLNKDCSEKNIMKTATI